MYDTFTVYHGKGVGGKNFLANPRAGKNGKKTWFSPQGEVVEELADRRIQTMHYLRVDQILRSLENPQELIRRWCLEGAIREGWLPSPLDDVEGCHCQIPAASPGDEVAES